MILLRALLGKEKLDYYLDNLIHRKKEIIRFRFGFIDKATHTLEETGKEFGISRERVRQIEAKALEDLKDIIFNNKRKCNFCERLFSKDQLSKPEGEEYSHILLCQYCLEDIMSGVRKIEEG